ncbi:hypothetical protein HYX14_01510 [Candidatus Woesearchaeota archaeon]|nr:hypothetical protein [Candidatus Woesearchaeota archaeon]
MIPKYAPINPALFEQVRKLPLSIRESMVQRILSKIHEDNKRVLREALERGLFTKEEYEKEYQDRFYDDYGSDSFLRYIDAVMDAQGECFLTENERLINVRDGLQKKFKLKIMSTKEAAETMEPKSD